MALLNEYSLIPDVFDSKSYSVDEIGDVHLQRLKEVLVEESVVRDLRAGEWSSLFTDTTRAWHLRGKELLKKLKQQNRLRYCDRAMDAAPVSDDDWCCEAIASHGSIPLSGIVATRRIASGHSNEPLVAQIDQLTSAPWWTSRSPSVRLGRTVQDYLDQANLILTCAKSVMFIDPHTDPNQQRYRGLLTLLQQMSGRSPSPSIELHRVCYFESQDKRDQLRDSEWRAMFNAWEEPLRRAGLSVEIFVWDDFHDRYLISNLVGISVPNGFDTTTSSNQTTTWTRLGRSDRDDIQREFDPSAGRHDLKHRFKVPS